MLSYERCFGVTELPHPRFGGELSNGGSWILLEARCARRSAVRRLLMATEAIATDISTASVTHHLVPATISQRSVISLMARWGLTLDSRDLEAGIVTLARAHGVTIGRAVETVDTVDVPSDVAGVLRRS